MVRYEDMDKAMKDAEIRKIKRTIKLVVFGVLGFILLILLFSTFYTVDAGDRGVLLTFGKTSDSIIQPGLHLKAPIIQSVVIMSVRTQTIRFDNPVNMTITTPNENDALSSASKDLQTVQTAVVVNYHINEQDVIDIYKKYGDSRTYQLNILEPIVRDAIKQTTAHFDAAQLVDNRSEVTQQGADLITGKFASKNAVLDNLNIVNFQYSPQYEKAIENKATAIQDALTEQNNLAKVQFQAQQRIAQAEGEAKAIQIQVAAINQAGGQNYVNLKWIEKWNGDVPSVVAGNAIPFIDMTTKSISPNVQYSNSTNTK